MLERGKVYLFNIPSSDIPKKLKLLFTCVATSMPGHTLNITKINRVHMGAYQCSADNGVPPSANATFLLEVHCKYNSAE